MQDDVQCRMGYSAGTHIIRTYIESESDNSLDNSSIPAVYYYYYAVMRCDRSLYKEKIKRKNNQRASCLVQDQASWTEQQCNNIFAATQKLKKSGLFEHYYES